jgi:spore coat polysaccharide biosynthesis protein SpsF
MGSKRLPGKVMSKLCDVTVLGHVLSRIGRAGAVDEIVVATTEGRDDDVVTLEAQRHGAEVVRGSEEDVLSRYHLAALRYTADVIVRITADCPLIDPSLLAEMVRHFHASRANGASMDYLSNTVERAFPRGLDVEVFTYDALERCHRAATAGYEREHVTPYIYMNPDAFFVVQWTKDGFAPEYRWTLDTPDDLKFMQAIYNALYRSSKEFSSRDVCALLRRQPDLISINAHVEQKDVRDAREVPEQRGTDNG